MKQSYENLVLIVDDEPAIRDMISRYLAKVGFSAITASNGLEALELFKERSPQVVITDVKMPSIDGIQFLKNVRKFNASTPVIFITGFPDMNTVIEAMHYGAYDYIIKPFRMEAVHAKVTQALNTVKLAKENVALTRLASLHDISFKMTNTHEVSKILDETFKFCLNVIKADSGAILLLNHEKTRLEVVRKKGVQPGPDVTLLSDEKEWPLSKWCVHNGKSLTVTNGDTFPEVTIDFPEKTSGSILCIPIRTNKEVIGVVGLNRKGEDAPFSELDRTMMEVITAQAGTGINNARLYTSLSEKVSELSLISSYSEQFVGLVDLIDVIRCLFETVLKNFAIDVIGFLVVKKRFHDFLYWSRGKLPDRWVNTVIEDTISEYNKAAKSFIVRKRVKPSFLEIVPSDGGLLKVPLVFKHTIPLI